MQARLADTENILKKIDKTERKSAKAERRLSGQQQPALARTSTASSLDQESVSGLDAASLTKQKQGMLSRMSFRNKKK